MSHSLHPACVLFPKLGDDELHALAEDIRQNGLLNPIVTLDGQILDGRNRLEACKIAGVMPRFVEWDGEGSALAWVVGMNLLRRHLTSSQRAVVAFALLPMFEAEAKERQRRSPGRGKKVAKLATSSGKASQIAARIAKTNSAYVEKVKSINRKAPEIIDEVKSGRITLNEAGRLSKIDEKKRKQIIAEAHRHPDEPVKRIMRKVLTATATKKETIPSSKKKSRIEIWCGDCVMLMRGRIADESISVVTTSPPYNQRVPYRSYDDGCDESEYLDWIDGVFTEIERVLTPDGSFFLVIGHAARKPWTAMRVADVAGKRFQLQNQIVWVNAITVDGESQGHFNPINGKRFLNHVWESVFHFTKSGKVPLDRLAIGVPYEVERNVGRTGSHLRCGGDVWFIPYETVHGGEDRGEHPATFPPQVAERCIKLAGIKLGMKVLDPFCGVNGMVAAARLGVDGIGIDIDPVYCKAARRWVGGGDGHDT